MHVPLPLAPSRVGAYRVLLWCGLGGTGADGITVRRVHRLRRAADGHASVTDAVKARDADAAEDGMRAHLKAARAELAKALDVS